jgi:plastocyanin
VNGSATHCRATAVCVAALVLVAACGDDDEPVATDAPPTPTALTSTTIVDDDGGPTIVIDAFVYLMPDVVSAGETVTLRNDDHADHSVTADDGSFSVFVAGDDTVTFVAPPPGSYPFYCRVHRDMRGELRVV